MRLLDGEAQLEGGDGVEVRVAGGDDASLALLVLELDADVGSTDAARLAIGRRQHVECDALEHVAGQQHLCGGQVTLLRVPQRVHQHIAHMLHLRLVPVRQVVQETEVFVIVALLDCLHGHFRWQLVLLGLLMHPSDCLWALDRYRRCPSHSVVSICEEEEGKL